MFQRCAFRQKSWRTTRWIWFCAIGGSFSGLLALPVSVVIGFAAPIGVQEVMGQVLQNAAVGALFGVVTAGALKWILWPQPSAAGTPSEAVSKEESAEI
ncbi:MAG TPA: hypothetical protein VFR18_10285 [Terriglobia bacterium]|nr:hypothetical protein [Terriglobia bacterium]